MLLFKLVSTVVSLPDFTSSEASTLHYQYESRTSQFFRAFYTSHLSSTTLQWINAAPFVFAQVSGKLPLP